MWDDVDACDEEDDACEDGADVWPSERDRLWLSCRGCAFSGLSVEVEDGGGGVGDETMRFRVALAPARFLGLEISTLLRGW